MGWAEIWAETIYGSPGVGRLVKRVNFRSLTRAAAGECSSPGTESGCVPRTPHPGTLHSGTSAPLAGRWLADAPTAPQRTAAEDWLFLPAQHLKPSRQKCLCVVFFQHRHDYSFHRWCVNFLTLLYHPFTLVEQSNCLLVDFSRMRNFGAIKYAASISAAPQIGILFPGPFT